MNIDKRMIARTRLRYAQGSGMVGILISLASLLTFAKVFESFFNQVGIPVLLVYLILPCVYVFLCWYVGMLYDTKGFWGEEQSHANVNMNPEFKQVCADIGEIKKRLEELNESKRREN